MKRNHQDQVRRRAHRTAQLRIQSQETFACSRVHVHLLAPGDVVGGTAGQRTGRCLVDRVPRPVPQEPQPSGLERPQLPLAALAAQHVEVQALGVAQVKGTLEAAVAMVIHGGVPHQGRLALPLDCGAGVVAVADACVHTCRGQTAS